MTPTRLVQVISVLVVIGLAWVADVARACPSCASPLEENRQAFVDTTIFLTLLPLFMIGGLIWWLRRRARQMNQGEPTIPVPDDLFGDAATPWSSRRGR